MVTGTGRVTAAAGRPAALAGDPDRSGVAVRLAEGSGCRQASVTSRMAAALREAIYAAPAVDGSRWLRWSRADRIAPAADAGAAASRVSWAVAAHD
jgi:hypothetical protein